MISPRILPRARLLPFFRVRAVRAGHFLDLVGLLAFGAGGQIGSIHRFFPSHSLAQNGTKISDTK